MKKIILVILICIFTINVQAIGRNEYVIDDAKILSIDTKNYILEYSNYLKDELKIDYVVITLDREYDDLEKEANALYEEYHISQKGLLFLVDKNSRNIQVLVGNKLSKIITDDIINEYINDYMVGYYKNDDWDDGTKNGYTAFFKLICNYYDIDSEILKVYDGDSFINKYRTYIITLIMIICIGIGYNLMTYYNNRYVKKNKKDVNIVNDIMFFCSMFINVELFIIAYYFGFKIFFMVFAIEIISIISSYYSHNTKKRSKKNGKSNTSR